MKKFWIAVVTGAVVLSMGATTAFAHHGGGRHGCGRYAAPAQSSTAANYPICTVEGCDQTCVHTHDGVTYACPYGAQNGTACPHNGTGCWNGANYGCHR